LRLQFFVTPIYSVQKNFSFTPCNIATMSERSRIVEAAFIRAPAALSFSEGLRGLENG